MVYPQEVLRDVVPGLEELAAARDISLTVCLDQAPTACVADPEGLAMLFKTITTARLLSSSPGDTVQASLLALPSQKPAAGAEVFHPPVEGRFLCMEVEQIARPPALDRRACHGSDAPAADERPMPAARESVTVRLTRELACRQGGAVHMEETPRMYTRACLPLETVLATAAPCAASNQS